MICAVVLICGFLVFNQYRKDVYYGYGRALALASGDFGSIEWDGHCIRIRNVGVYEVYIGSVAKSVYKVLLKNSYPVVDSS